VAIKKPSKKSLPMPMMEEDVEMMSLPEDESMAPEEMEDGEMEEMEMEDEEMKDVESELSAISDEELLNEIKKRGLSLNSAPKGSSTPEEY